MLLLLAARLLIAAVPFRIWRKWLGGQARVQNRVDALAARRLAAHIERAAYRLPITIKCLPQAMALSWQLRRSGLAHSIVFAVRPPSHRDGRCDLHAWIEVGSKVVLGDLPGPWLRMLDQGG